MGKKNYLLEVTVTDGQQFNFLFDDTMMDPVKDLIF